MARRYVKNIYDLIVRGLLRTFERLWQDNIKFGRREVVYENDD